MALEDIMLCEETRERKENTECSHFYVEPKNIKLIETNSRMVVTRGRGEGKWGNVGQML